MLLFFMKAVEASALFCVNLSFLGHTVFLIPIMSGPSFPVYSISCSPEDRGPLRP